MLRVLRRESLLSSWDWEHQREVLEIGQPVSQDHDEPTDSQEGAHEDLGLVAHLEDDRLDEVVDDEREAVGDVVQLGAHGLEAGK